MDGAARADALHNFLPYVASLGEVQRTLLAGFLRKIALTNVHAIQRPAANNSLQLQRLGTNRLRSGADERVPKLAHVFRSDPDFESGELFVIVIGANQRAGNFF